MASHPSESPLAQDRIDRFGRRVALIGAVVLTALLVLGILFLFRTTGWET